jgi:transposase-like protein
MDAPDRAASRDAQRPRVETTERRCPSCRSEQVAPIGQTTAAFGVIKSSYQCEACELRFMYVRTALG